MNQSNERYLELDAGRALGNLSAAEELEWQKLNESLGEPAQEAIPLDELVNALNSAMTNDVEDSEPMPNSVKARALELAKEHPKNNSKPNKPIFTWISHPGVGWAVAACLAITLFLQSFSEPALSDPSKTILTAVNEDSGASRFQFKRLEASYGELNGEVVWSDSLQQGYLKLTGLNPNNPTDQQFQLWIFDPERDENPVDGGVFDVASADTVIIPINAKLEINQPNAFAITVEQPGGVVVSKRKMLLALAQ